MKEKIYTIPVNDAFDSGGECPFCTLGQKLEKEVLDYVMGPSYMEEDVREQTDLMGFCKEHYRQMLAAGNRLGVVIMLKTHIKKINDDMKDILKREEERCEGRKKLFSKNDEPSPFCEYENKLSESCYACNRIEGRMTSYFDTFFHLWKTEDEFRAKITGGKGFCMEHFARLLAESEKKLNAAARKQLIDALIPIQQQSFKRLEDEVEWFIKKFDYRFKDEPWKTSKDAAERGILKVSGYNGGVL